MKLLGEVPQKDGFETVYKCGLRLSGTWGSRLTEWRKFKRSTMGAYIIKLESK